MNILDITKVYTDLEECAEYWHAALLANKQAKEYVLSRIPMKLVKTRKLGVCFDFPEECAISLHATENKKRRKAHPIFWGRLTIPIVDAGYTVGFGARNLKDDKFSKYLNSPDSDYYQKASTLYNLWEAKRYIHKSGFAILLEGYFDVLGLWDVGIRNTVATCGTALTTRQVEKLRYFTDTVLVWYDGDKAGKEAAKRSKKILGKAGVSAQIFSTPGYDPFDVSKKFTKEKILEKLERKLHG